MIHHLNELGIEFRVNALITAHNCSVEEVDELIHYLKSFDNFYEMSLGFVGYSHYKSSEENQRMFPDSKQAEQVYNELFNKYKEDKIVSISEIQTHEDNFRFTMDKFKTKPMCTGNMHSFYILPDGKVTICEELYWHPEFIIGDLSKDSIMDVWNSEKALGLIHMHQSKVQSNSPCSNCKDFDSCRQSSAVCWREVIKSYGNENWDYPDPRCPKAPEPIENIYFS